VNWGAKKTYGNLGRVFGVMAEQPLFLGHTIFRVYSETKNHVMKLRMLGLFEQISRFS
jgi:hypothetical protein